MFFKQYLGFQTAMFTSHLGMVRIFSEMFKKHAETQACFGKKEKKMTHLITIQMEGKSFLKSSRSKPKTSVNTSNQ